jgi:hypothetical protein
MRELGAALLAELYCAFLNRLKQNEHEHDKLIPSGHECGWDDPEAQFIYFRHRDGEPDTRHVFWVDACNIQVEHQVYGAKGWSRNGGSTFELANPNTDPDKLMELAICGNLRTHSCVTFTTT